MSDKAPLVDHTQVELRRPSAIAGHDDVIILWVPPDLAKIGTRLSVYDTEWSHGWRVAQRYSTVAIGPVPYRYRRPVDDARASG